MTVTASTTNGLDITVTDAAEIADVQDDRITIQMGSQPAGSTDPDNFILMHVTITRQELLALVGELTTGAYKATGGQA